MHTVTLVATAVAGAEDEAAVVSAVLDVGARLGARADVLYVADESRRELRLAGHRGLPDDMVDSVRRFDFDAPLLAALAARTRRIQSATPGDLVSTPIARELVGRVSAQALLALPLISRGRLLGVHAIATSGPPPEPEHMWAHHTISEIIALGLSNAYAQEDERRLTRSLDRERATLAAVLRNAPYPIVFTEAGSKEPHLNLKAREIVGAEEPTEVKLLDPDGSRVVDTESDEARVMRGEEVERKAIVEFADGRRRNMLLRRSKASSADGTFLGIVGVFEDISARLELERLREEWASIVAHDMRQPLNVLSIVFSTLAEASQELPDSIRKPIEMGQHAVHRLDQMTHDLSEVSLVESGRLQLDLGPVHLVDVLREIVDLLRLTTGRSVSVATGGELPPIRADRRRVEQVFMNLLSNAIKYSTAGTVISVGISAGASEVQVDVQNRGAGIPADELPRLFDRFYRARDARAGRADGLGLGLFITRGFVEAHRGRITVTSVPDEQTTFTVWLPTHVPE